MRSGAREQITQTPHTKRKGVDPHVESAGGLPFRKCAHGTTIGEHRPKSLWGTHGT